MKTASTRLLLGLLLAGSPIAAAEVPEATPGELVEGLTSPEGERYAVYLPTAYRARSPWPVLIVMDPRGRAAHAARIFQDAAERFGYLVLSSESTRSDIPSGAENPNEAALRELLEVAIHDYSSDPARVYLAGFSGTSRFAWVAGSAFPDRIAGIVGVGGGLPGPWQEWNRVAFSYFGAAGTFDFNHREMRELDELLDGVLPHRFSYFVGGHQWLRPEDAVEALAWMELEAMRRELAPKREELVQTLLAERLSAAGEAETRGLAFEAFEALLAIAEDFDGLASDADLDRAAERAAALGRDERVDRVTREIRKAIERERAYRETVGTVVRRIAYEGKPPNVPELRSELEVAALQAKASGSSRAAASARRQLELAFVHTAFYTPNGLLAQGAPRRAALCLELATSIFPERVMPWVKLAEAQTRAGRRKAAVRALTEALALGFSDAAFLRSQEWFGELSGHEAFRELLGASGRESSAPKSD